MKKIKSSIYCNKEFPMGGSDTKKQEQLELIELLTMKEETGLSETS